MPSTATLSGFGRACSVSGDQSCARQAVTSGMRVGEQIVCRKAPTQGRAWFPQMALGRSSTLLLAQLVVHRLLAANSTALTDLTTCNARACNLADLMMSNGLDLTASYNSRQDNSLLHTLRQRATTTDLEFSGAYFSFFPHFYLDILYTYPYVYYVP